MTQQYLQIFLTGQPAVGKTTILKHIIHELLNDSVISNALSLRGFYTEECCETPTHYNGDPHLNPHSNNSSSTKNQSSRPKSQRIGFDIVYWNFPNDNSPKREPLSRISTTSIPKGTPHVGKYVVNVENIEKYAVASLSNHVGQTSSTQSSSTKLYELVLLDEVGKMEMLCPKFIPAVHELLDETSDMNHGCKIRVILGTLPTPRYGRVIPQVENIRTRKDLIVVHVTKSNRDELKTILCDIVKKCFGNHQSTSLSMDSSSAVLLQSLEPFLYTKPCTAHSTADRTITAMESTHTTHNITTMLSTACEPMFTNDPKIMLLGETASPKPNDPTYSYCERSMWAVLSRMFGIEYNPVKDISTATQDELASYVRLKEKVLSVGICIWDVYSNVHESLPRNGTRKRRKMGSQLHHDMKSNDIGTFLEKHPSVQKIVLIGKKARASFDRHVSLPDSVNVSIVTVPSSSPANSRMTMDQKVQEWKKALAL